VVGAPSWLGVDEWSSSTRTLVGAVVSGLCLGAGAILISAAHKTIPGWRRSVPWIVVIAILVLAAMARQGLEELVSNPWEWYGVSVRELVLSGGVAVALLAVVLFCAAQKTSIGRATARL